MKRTVHILGNPFCLEIRASRAIIHDMERGDFLHRDCTPDELAAAACALRGQRGQEFGDIVIGRLSTEIDEAERIAA